MAWDEIEEARQRAEQKMFSPSPASQGAAPEGWGDLLDCAAKHISAEWRKDTGIVVDKSVVVAAIAGVLNGSVPAPTVSAPLQEIRQAIAAIEREDDPDSAKPWLVSHVLRHLRAAAEGLAAPTVDGEAIRRAREEGERAGLERALEIARSLDREVPEHDRAGKPRATPLVVGDILMRSVGQAFVKRLQEEIAASPKGEETASEQAVKADLLSWWNSNQSLNEAAFARLLAAGWVKVESYSLTAAGEEALVEAMRAASSTSQAEG